LTIHEKSNILVVSLYMLNVFRPSFEVAREGRISKKITVTTSNCWCFYLLPGLMPLPYHRSWP